MHASGVHVKSRDRACGVNAVGSVPCPAFVPAPGASKVVIAPALVRTKPCSALAESTLNPVMTPPALMLVPAVSLTPLPGASKLVYLALGVRTNPCPTLSLSTKAPVIVPAVVDGDSNGPLPRGFACVRIVKRDDGLGRRGHSRSRDKCNGPNVLQACR
jgi:hypothetical protein